MRKLINKLVLALVVFPPLYIIGRFLKWSWRSWQKELEDIAEQ